MSQENKDMIKHAIISILVGAIIAFISALAQGILTFLHDGHFNMAAPLAGMIYYIKARKVA